MTYRGYIKNGRVRVDAPLDLPEGTIVNVRPVRSKRAHRRREPSQVAPTTWGRALLRYAGQASGLPADLARNHDHYLYGLPKKRNQSSRTRRIASRCSTRTTSSTRGLTT